MLAHFQCAVMHALLQYEVSLGDEVVFDLVTHVTHGREIQVERGVVVAGEFGDLTHRDLLDRLGLVQLPERLLEALDRLLRKLRVLLDCDSRYGYCAQNAQSHRLVGQVRDLHRRDALAGGHAGRAFGIPGNRARGAILGTVRHRAWCGDHDHRPVLRRRWTVPASGEDSPDDAVPAVEITAETEA